uniref:Ig-like domain-containing protein n=1 Tax=Magallana gigas TaxID=29159 RepID=A0A8W8N8X5_MAGGI
MHWFTIILVGSVYQTPSVSTFSVSINASTKSINSGENVHIDCAIFGLSPLQYLNSQVTLLLRQNDSIKTAVRIWTDGSHNVTEKYGGTVNYYIDDECQLRNRILVRFDIFNKTEKLSNYVVVRHVETLESSIPYFCCKYGFNILENESFVNFINFRHNESAYFPVIPTFYSNNNAIAIVKPWISYEDNDSTLIMIIPMTVFGFLLIVVAVVWVIHRVNRNCGSRNVSVINNEYIYSYPSETQEVATTIIRRGLDDNFINQTEAYSDLRNETHFSNEYTLTDENDEYDV